MYRSRGKLVCRMSHPLPHLLAAAGIATGYGVNSSIPSSSSALWYDPVHWPSGRLVLRVGDLAFSI